MSYQGVEASIPLGEIGLLTDRAPLSLPPGALIEAKNVVFNNGMVEKAPGALIYNTAHQLDGEIVALHDWWPTTDLQRLIAVTSTGKIYRDTGDRTFSGGVEIADDVPQIDPRSTFAEGGNETAGRGKKLFLFSNGAYQMKALDGDGTAFADVTLPAADWSMGSYPTVGLVHRNRLWAFSGQRAYASNSGDHEDFQNSILTQSIFPGEGGDIIGVFVYRGRMFAFKEGNFVYYLNESDSSSSNWYWLKLSSNFGLASPNGIINALNDMLVGNATGTVTSYRGAESLGDIESADIFRMTMMERHLRANTSPIGLPTMHALYDQEKKQAYFTYRSTYTTANDMLVNVDMNSNNPRVSYLQKGTPVCLAERRGINNIPVPMYGGADGYVYMMNYEDRLEGAAAYEGAFQIAHTDFRYVDPGLMNKQKHFDWLTVEFGPECNCDLSIDVIIDGKFTQTVTAKMQAQGNYLDEFLLDTDRLSQYTTQSARLYLAGMGKRVSFRCYNAGSNESFQVASLTVGFRVGSQDNSRF